MLNTFEFLKVVGSEMLPYVQELARLRCEIFSEYPYLYIGDKNYEEKYLENYAKQSRSFLIVVKKNGEVIGASSAMPLSDEKFIEIKSPIEQAGYNIENVFLYGESLLKKQFRGLGIGKIFFTERENFVRSFESNYKHIVFFAIERPLNHPKRPVDYQDLFDFWKRMGFEKTNIKFQFPYQEIGETTESLKPMVFWIKNFAFKIQNNV